VLESASAPSYRASIERRVARRTWLVLNAEYVNSVTEFPLTTLGFSPIHRTIKMSFNSIGALAGLRHAIVSGIVEVSFFATLGFRHEWIGGQRPTWGESFDGSSGVPMLAGSKSNIFEALAGIAVERELMEALTLRLSTGVAGFAFSKSSVVSNTADETERTERSSSGLRLELSPAIELRFYF
jgi:hypothetical protein